MLLWPQALADVLGYHAARGLQLESSLGVLLGAWRTLTGTSVWGTVSYGSFNFDGPFPDLLARCCLPLMFAVIVGVTMWFARAPAATDDVERRDRLALALLAGLASLWLTGKVFSPQYLTWDPDRPRGLGDLGRRLTWIFFGLLVATQVYLRGYYPEVVHQSLIGVGSLLVRLGLLVWFLVAVLRGVRAPEPRVEAVTA